MKFSAIAMVFLFLFANAGAAQPSWAIMDASRPYSTLIDAAKGALGRALALADSIEHGGALLYCIGEYFATHPVSGDHKSVNYRIRIPVGCILAGTYHTHPLGFAGEFSPGDVATAKRLSIPSFLGMSIGGTMYVFYPNLMRVFPGGSAFGKRLQESKS